MTRPIRPPSARRRSPLPPLRLALALGLCAALSPTSLLSQSDTFSDAASVVVVEVPVQVVDRDGNPVRGLSKDDFEIQEGRKEREILYFDVFDLTSPGALERRDLTPSARRHFLLLFDLSFATPSSILRAREAARGILDDLHASDLVAVGTVSVSRGTELVLAFTPDRKAVELAIDTLGAPQLVDRGTEPLGVMLSGLKSSEGGSPGSTAAASGAGGESPGGATGIEEAVEDYIESIVDTVNRSDRDAQVGRIQGMTRSMGQLAALMRAVDGRKHVVYLSEGFDSRLLTGNTGSLAGSDASASTAGSIETGTVWEVDTDEMFGSGRLQNTLERMLEEFRRADCAIHAVDIGGLRAPGEGPASINGQDGLVAMARGTGGEMYQNFNDLGAAMGRMLESTGVTYVLAFQPDDLPADGSYRKLKVSLRNAPRGARLVHRPGYFAPRPGGQRSPGEEKLQVASQLLSGRSGGAIGVKLLAVPFAVPGSRSAVPVLIEMDGAALVSRAADGRASLEVYAYALGGEGSVGDSFFQTLGLDLSNVGDRLRRGGVKLYGQLDLEPGLYNLRVLVRDPASGASGLASLGLEVPDFAGDKLALLPPLVPEMDLDRWLMVRQPPGPDRQQIPYPFILDQGQSFIPAAEPVIQGARPVNIGVFAYNLGTAEPLLNAQVVNASGDVVLGQQLPVLERRGGGEGEPTRLLTALQLPGVAPGDYTLTVGLVDRAGGRRGLTALPIRVEAGPAGEEVASLPGPSAGTADPSSAQLPELSGRGSQRFPVLKAAYQRALAQLSAGEEEAAREALLALEQAERGASDDVVLSVLAAAEMEAALQLAGKNPDSLIPVMLLHEAAYHVYRERSSPLLALHNRTMVRDLAELYVKAGGSPTSLAASVFTSLGGSLQQAGLTRAGNSLFERALDLRPEDEGALLSLAVYYEKTGDYDRAARFLERLTAAHPANSEGWLRLGINLRRQGKGQQAAEWLLKACGREAPAWVRSLAYQERSHQALAAGQLAEAERILSAGVEEVPGDQNLLLQLSHVLDRRGRTGSALAVLGDLQPAPPGLEDSPRYRYNRWPVHVLETGRQQLRETAVQRLPLLAGVIRALPESEWSR